MALIVRIDVDRPYGKSPFFRHVFSRVASDAWFPKFHALGYLRELMVILQILNAARARSHIFFRRCTLPSKPVLELIDAGGHEIGLHLEDSRSFQSFYHEKTLLERHIGRPIVCISKHGSGKHKYGFHHFAPYEPEKYIQWSRRSGIKVFLGNLEDPTIRPFEDDTGLQVYPSAFWLEPSWRDTKKFPVDWLLTHAISQDIVLLMHPDNILAELSLTEDLKSLLAALDTRLLA